MKKRAVMFGLLGLTFGVLAVQAQEMPMAGMKKGSAASQAASMTEMMGAPGLVPFDIMTGQAGKWMVGYQFMFEKLNGILDGTHGISNANVLNRFETTPTDMTMQMHMAMVMYAPTNKLTLMAMLPYIKMSMGELHRDGTRSTERSQGIGDLEFRVLYSLYAPKGLHHRILLNFGLGFPTGSVNQRDAQGARMEYPMQIGAGTFSLLPGITYLGQTLPWGWAMDFNATLPFGWNDIGYRLGNRYQSSATIARQFTDWLSMSIGVRGEFWENIHGFDSLLDPTDEPTKDPNLQGGKRLSILFGITFHPQQGLLKGQHLHVLCEVPMVQSLDGPQLQRSWVIRLGWQLEF
jgi:Putative MetA-pathway of phenol degradation